MTCDTKTASVNYDEILSHIGQFGPWQRRVFFLLWLTGMAAGLDAVVFIFAAYNLGHRCPIPYCDGPEGLVINDTSRIESSRQCEYVTISK